MGDAGQHGRFSESPSPRREQSQSQSPPWKGSRGDSPSKQGHSRSHSFRREKRDASPRQEHSRSRSRSPAWRKEDQSRQDPSNPRSRSRSPAWRKEDQTRHDPSNPGNNLYVTGLSTRVTEKDLERHLSREGKVLECRVVVDPRTRESRGFGFVTMDNLDDAERCIKYLNRSTLEGRMITIEKAKRKRARTPTPGEYLGIRAPVRSRPHRSGGYRRDSRDGRDSRDSRDGHSSRRSPHYSPYRSRRDSRDRY